MGHSIYLLDKNFLTRSITRWERHQRALNCINTYRRTQAPPFTLITFQPSPTALLDSHSAGLQIETAALVLTTWRLQEARPQEAIRHFPQGGPSLGLPVLEATKLFPNAGQRISQIPGFSPLPMDGKGPIRIYMAKLC